MLLILQKSCTCFVDKRHYSISYNTAYLLQSHVSSSLFGKKYVHFTDVSRQEPGSSVSIVSGYGLDDRTIDGRSPAERKDFSSSPVSRPALWSIHPPLQWVPGVLSPGVKRGRGVTLTTHIHLVSRTRMSRSYISSPPKRLRGV
jgi:hypothetical protein